jgi:hypothetical protein
VVAANPAGRLLDILTEGKRLNLGTPALSGWARTFGLEVNGRNNEISLDVEKETVSRLIQLQQLVAETEQKILSIDGINHTLYLSPFPRIKNVVRFSAFNSPFNNLLAPVSDSDLIILAFCSEKLSEQHSERVIDEKDLQELLSEINTLFDEVNASDAPDPLKKFILRQLENIRRAIQEYRIRGTERLQEALEHLVGAVDLHAELVKSAPKSEYFEKFKRVINRFVSFVEFAQKLQPLLSAGIRVGSLLSGDPEVPPVDIPPSE